MSAPLTGWAWRKAYGGVLLDTDIANGHVRLFHAYGADDLAACEPYCGLSASCEEPNEGSDFCPECMNIARTSLPAGSR